MKKIDLNELFDCPSHMEEKVLALTEGKVKDHDERYRILMHIVSCDFCTELFQDSLLFPLEETDETPVSMPSIIVKLGKGILDALDSLFVPPAHPAQVLAGEKIPVLDYSIDTDKTTIPVRITGNDDMVRVEISCDDSKTRFYLVHGNDFTVAHPRNGVAVFDNVRPGTYVLSRDLDSFISLSVQ